jgi:hypothetical protein
VVIDFVLVLAAAPDNIPSSGYLIGYSRTDKESEHTFEHHFYPQVGQEGLDGPKVIAAGSDSFARWYGAILHHLSDVTVYPPSLYSYLGERLTVVPWKEKPY